MAASFKCTLTIPEATVFDGTVNLAVVPASDGELGILARHAPLVSSLGFGEMRVDVEQGDRARFFVDGGFVQVLDNQVSVIAARAVAAADLDISAEEERIEALRALEPGATAEARHEHARTIEAAKARLRFAKRYVDLW